MEIAPGMVVLGRYRVDSILGTGGMGLVVRATHIYMAQPVAIKFLKRDMVADHGIVQRFLREAHATVRLRGDHIARVIDVGMIEDGTPFMVMEFLEGADLNQILRHHGAQPATLVCDMLLQACEGIAEAHAIGIIHRDLKPSNCFVTRRLDGRPLLKILDFGISKAPAGFDAELTKTSAVVGTPAYMAPEQMMSARGVDARSDIWSLGIVMYQLLTGRLPFAAEQYAELCIKVSTHPPTPIGTPLPPGLGEVLLRCLEKDPAMRFQAVSELADALAPFSTDPNEGYTIADRTRRILASQGPGPTLVSDGPSGPYTPSPFTPPPRGSPSSIGGSAGQLMMSRTQVVGKRSLIIVGTAAVVVGIAGGAYFAMREARSADVAATIAPASQPASQPANQPAATAPAPAPDPVPEPAAAPVAVTEPVPSAPSAPVAPPGPTMIVIKPETEKAIADQAKKPASGARGKPRAPTEPAPVAERAPGDEILFDKTTADKKPASTKKPAATTTAPPPKKKPPADDDLFDDRR